MDKSVLQMILNHVPDAKIIESGDNGAYKIRLPYCWNEMAGYQELRRALKESPAKPICSTCRSENTKFRYFDNSSSKALQARYKCLTCNHLFTLGGKQYCKDHHTARGHEHQKKEKINFKDHDEHDLISGKKIKSQEVNCSSTSRTDADVEYSVQNVETLKPVNFIDYFQQDALNYVQRPLDFHKQYWSQFKQYPTDHEEDLESPGLSEVVPLRYLKQYPTDHDEDLESPGLSEVVPLRYLKQKEGDHPDEQHSIELQLWF